MESRRGFLKSAGAGIAATGMCVSDISSGRAADREREAGADRLQHLADPLHLQEPHRLRPQPAQPRS